MSVNSGNITPDEIITAAFQLTLTKYTAIAGFIIWLWDLCLTLDDEVILLWSNPQWKKGTLIKVLYLVNRYLPVVGLAIVLYDEDPLRTVAISISTSVFCRGTYFAMLFCQAAEVVVATSIFAARLYTIFTGRPFIQRFLLTMLFLSHISIFLFAFLSYYYVYPTVYYDAFALGCSGVPPWSWGGLYLTPIFIETVIVTLTVYHAVYFRKDREGLEGTVAASILSQLYLDGLVYFMIVLTLRIGTSLVFFLAPLAMILLFCYLEYAVTSALTARWFLSFRRTVLDTRPSLSVSECSEGGFETGHGITGLVDGYDQHKHKYRGRHPDLELETFGSTCSEVNVHTQ